eukprot:g3003.t1
MDIEGFVAEQKDLLRREYESELEQADNARDKISGGELQRMGKALLGLRCEVSTGTFGRFILSLKATSVEAEKAGAKRMIVANKFSVGSVVRITKGSATKKRTKRGGSEDDRAAEPSHLTGVVSRRTQVSLKIMVDSNTSYDVIDEYRFCSNVRIDLMPDKETYKRLSAGLDRLLRCPPWASNIVAPLFRQSAFDTFTTARSDERDDELTWLNKGLNESQRRAVRMCMSVKDVAFVHGPPGTGKTTTLVEFIHQEVRRGSRILVCAPSNVAVDNIVVRLAKSMARKMTTAAAKTSERRKMRMVRLGHIARLMKEVEEHSLEAMVRSSQQATVIREAKDEIDSIRAQISKVRTSSADRHAVGRRVKDLRAEMSEIRRDVRRRERFLTSSIVQSCNVVLCTLTGSAHLRKFTASEDRGQQGGSGRSQIDEGAFDVVVIDEAAQSLEAACWLALCQARRAVLAGDHRQLPPTIMSKESSVRKKLGRTLFERDYGHLRRRNANAGIAMKGSSSVLLDTQYRMNDKINRWASKSMYASKLMSHPSVASRELNDLVGVSVPSTPVMLLIDTAGAGVDFEESVDDADPKSGTSGSKSNVGEARIVMNRIVALLKGGMSPTMICCITPYNAQVALIRSMLRARAEEEDGTSVVSRLCDVEVRSVDGFQGQEKDAVILSLVRSNRKSAIGFLKDRRRLNVAVTRAKRHVTIVADSTTVSTDPFIRSLLSHVESCGDVQSVFTLNDVSEESACLDDAKVTKHSSVGGADERAEELRERVRAFATTVLREKDVTKRLRMHMRFPRSLTKDERRVVHEEAERFDCLSSESRGSGVFRQLMLTPRLTRTEQAPTTQDDKKEAMDGETSEHANDHAKTRCDAGDEANTRTMKDASAQDEATSALPRCPITLKVRYKGTNHSISIECANRETFRTLGKYIEIATSVPTSEQKIIFKGKKWTESNQTLASAGLRDGSRVMLMRSAASMCSTAAHVSSSLTTSAGTSSSRHYQRRRRRLQAEKKKKKKSTLSTKGETVSSSMVASKQMRWGRTGAANSDSQDLADRSKSRAKSEEDVEHVLRAAMSDGCAHPGCKFKTATLYRLTCKVCRRRFCPRHQTPESHGCEEDASREARRKAREAGSRMSATGHTKAPAPLPEWKRSALRRQLQKRIDGKASDRQRKNDEKDAKKRTGRRKRGGRRR